MALVVILIPPSEGKFPSGTEKPLGRLSKDVQKIYDRLMAYRGDFSKLYGVKGKALESAQLSNKQLVGSLTLPAIERYNGVVYDGIDYSSLNGKAKSFFNTHVRIVSALFGLLQPQDLIPDYKLKMEKLDAARFWKPIIAQKLQGCFVIDLLPQAHQKAVAYDEGIKIDFIVTKKGKSIAAGHWGKLIKGQFVRWICENGVANPKDFSGFSRDGFKFDGANFVKSQS